MGLIDALVGSSTRFATDLFPTGYDERVIKWKIEIDPEKNVAALQGPYKKEKVLIRPVPTRADRSGKVSKNNIKPSLFVDNARYALGLGEGQATSLAFKAFVDLHRATAKEMRARAAKAASPRERESLQGGIAQLEAICRFLGLPTEERRKRVTAANSSFPDPNDVVTFVAGTVFPFDLPACQEYWSEYLTSQCAHSKGTCGICGSDDRQLLRIVPFKIGLFGERCPVTAVNTDEQQSFGSHGKTQLINSPICMDCASAADRTLKHLLKLDKEADGKEASSGRHAVILARDDSRGQGKQPLRNQVAVFWTKNPVVLEDAADAVHGRMRTLEEVIRVPLAGVDDIPGQGPPAYASQIRDLLQAPFQGGKDASELAANRFFLAVLSPNKSRLVVREWLEQGVETVRQHLKHYVGALQIIHPDGRGVWFPPLPAMLRALCSVTSSNKKDQERPRLPQVGPDVMRKLIRCVYAGLPPPEALLPRALRCFRVPDAATDGEQGERQMLRRMAMTAAMKLVLTHSKSREEQRAMEELKTEHDAACDYKIQPPYLCGRLLAVLEAVQRRSSSSGRGVNTTLVDRFYGAASTAPATVFANLINMTTKAHLPKLRREGKEFFRTGSSGDKSVKINDLMAEVCAALDDAGGFPPHLTPEQQAQFALGFYHQRAEFKAK